MLVSTPVDDTPRGMTPREWRELNELDTTFTPARLAKQLLKILENDKPRLRRIDDYLHGHHDDPYMPDRADEEYKLLAKRAVSNWIPLLVGTPAQAMYVDNFRKGNSPADIDSNGVARVTQVETSLEMRHWQRSRLDARQGAIYRGALAYGHSFTVTEKVKGVPVPITKGLSALKTSAVFEDPANDNTPYAALTIESYPKSDSAGKQSKPGKATMWDGRWEYAVTFKSLADLEKGVSVKAVKRHGATECPVTRFAAVIDLEGRTVGVVEPLIPLQNRINQTVFDLLVAQTYGSFQVRTVTGMVPPQKMKPVYAIEGDSSSEIVDWEPMFDEQTGQPIPADINLNARRFLFAEDHEASFSSLPGTPLAGYIDSIDMSVRHLAAVSQTPPHYLLGQIANLSAEAITAAETALSRKVEEFKHSFGESWERVFRLAAEMSGDAQSAEDFNGEVIWRDLEGRSLSQAADALGKLAASLDIPKRGLWARVPGATQAEIEQWEDLADQDPEMQLALSLKRATLGLTENQGDLAAAQANLAEVQAESDPGPAQTDNVFSAHTQSKVRE